MCKNSKCQGPYLCQNLPNMNYLPTCTSRLVVQYESPITCGKIVMAKDKAFQKKVQTSRSRSQGQKLRYQVKGLVSRNTHAQHESPNLRPD